MRVRDAMSKSVISVGPGATVGEIAALLVQHRISAVPVVAKDGRVIGIVSQTDLGHRSETETEKKRKWWLDYFADADALAREYVKSHGRLAADVMTRHIVSASQDASLAEVADILDKHRVRQVPVMDNGQLVGMISRADLVRALAQAQTAAPSDHPDNSKLQKMIWDRINAESWLHAAFVNLVVKDGVVDLYGAVDSEDQRRALRVLIEGVQGVRKVEDNVKLLPKVVAT